jgi:dihydrofolate reductase
MRKVIVDMVMSLDGYFEGPNRELDWFVWDKDMEKYAIDASGTVDTILFGGAGLLSTFARLGLVDEYHFRVNPLILGKGRLLFGDIKERLNLKLIKTETFGSGVVMLFYRPA